MYRVGAGAELIFECTDLVEELVNRAGERLTTSAMKKCARTE